MTSTGWMVIDASDDPVVRAHFDDGRELVPYRGADDWRQALAWLRARTDTVYCRLEGDGFYIWVGRGPSPDPVHRPPMRDDVLGHVDFAIDAVRRLRDQHRDEIEAIQQRHRAAAAASSAPPEGGPWVHHVVAIDDPHLPHPGLVDGPVIIDGDEPHVLAGWWAAATGYRHRYLAQAVTALGTDGGTPNLGFRRAAPSAPVRIALVAADVDDLITRLLDLGGTPVAAPPGSRGIADPAGNIAEITLLPTSGHDRR